ncbi:hypothetical protein EVAR_66493_1 [Eumeta japonica]|uniref:Uncharacterized protein n=1 Tax=Eumeta variegata TaxID=151549 RepID=A0A4C2AI38_EUMVA|nr:hypothetical protein EVAR_66493_1 [Eumeta japonica]
MILLAHDDARVSTTATSATRPTMAVGFSYAMSQMHKGGSRILQPSRSVGLQCLRRSPEKQKQSLLILMRSRLRASTYARTLTYSRHSWDGLNRSLGHLIVSIQGLMKTRFLKIKPKTPTVFKESWQMTMRQYPHAATILSEDVYMDDVPAGNSSLETATYLKD